MMFNKCSFLFLYVLIFSLSFSTCSNPKYTSYDVVVYIHEFEIKHSHDLIDTKPEAFIRVSTDSQSEDSEKYNEYSVNFAEEGKLLKFSMKGETVNSINISLVFYDYDWLDALFGEEEDDGEDYISGATNSYTLPTDEIHETIVFENRELYVKYSLDITNIVKEK